MMRGFEEDEGFWEFGLHFFLIFLFAAPILGVIEYLVRLADIEEHGAAAFGMLLGVLIGDSVVTRLRRRFRPEHTEQGSMQALHLIVPIALPIAILWDYLMTLIGGEDVGFSALGVVCVALPLGHWAFHGLRNRLWRKPADDG